jgi:hypothetical protein
LAPEKFYAAAIADGDVDLDRLAELIPYQCTVTETDCYAVLLALEHNIIGELGQGRIVKLGSGTQKRYSNRTRRTSINITITFQ